MSMFIKITQMFSNIPSNENINLTPSSANTSYKFGFNYLNKADKSHSYSKITNQREYCFSHAKKNKVDKYHTYGEPAWKEINQNHYHNKPHQFAALLNDHSARKTTNNDISFTKKQNCKLKDKIGLLESEVVVKQSIIKHQKREIQELKQAAKKWQKQSTPPLETQLLNHIKTDKNKLSSQIVKLQQELRLVSDENKSAKEQYQELQKKYDKVLSEMPDKDQLLQKKNSLIEFLQLELKKVLKSKEQGQEGEKIMNSFKQKNKDLKEEVEALKKRVKDFEEQNQKISTKTTSTNFVTLGDQSVVSPLHLDSAPEVEKLTVQIRKKNQMIKYLEYQCMKNVKADEFELIKSEKQKLHDQYTTTQKQLAKIIRISEILKKESTDFQDQLQKSQSEKKNLKEKVQQLFYAKNKSKCQRENLISKIKAYEEKLEDLKDEKNVKHQQWQKERQYLGKKLSDALIKAEQTEKFYQETVQELRQRYKEQSEEYKSLKQKDSLLNGLSEKYNCLAQEYDHLLTERQIFKAQVEQKEVLIIRLESKISSQEEMINLCKLNETSRIENLQQEIKEKELSYAESMAALQAQKNELVHQIKDMIQKIKDAEIRSNECQKKLEEKELERKELNIFLLQLQKDSIKKDEQIMNQKQEREKTEKDQKNLQQLIKQSTKTIQSLKQKLKAHEDEEEMLIQKLKEEKNLLEVRIEEIECQFKQYRAQQKNQETEKSQLEAKMQALTEIIGTLNKKVQFLENQKMKVFSSLSQNKQETQNNQNQKNNTNKSRDQTILIDKKSLIEICKIINVDPNEGQILKLIIQKLQDKRDEKKYEQTYFEIMDLFSIPARSKNAHQKLIESFKSMILKAKQLENSTQNLRNRLDRSREAEHHHHQIIHQLSSLLSHHNEEKMKSMASVLSDKYQNEEI